MIKIASSISYNAPFFLDARQYVTVPEGKEYHEVLKNWNIPIPDGFEVFCNGSWWTYGKNNPETITGKFRKRSVSGGGGSDTSFTVVVNHPSGSECCIPQNTHLDSLQLEWDCQYDGDTVSPASISIKVGNEPIIVIDDPSTGRYLLEEEIYGGTDIIITAAYAGEATSSVIHMLSTYVKYYGVLLSPEITENDVERLTVVNSDTNASLSERLFDCTGGRYPYYLIPSSLYRQVSDTLKMYVGGWMNTDYVTQSVMINGEEYTVIRHGYLQTGKLYIKFEER